MKISSRIEGSFRGAILSPHRALWSNTSNGGHPRTVYGSQARSRRRQQARSPRSTSSKHHHAESEFFTPWIPPPVLVKAVPSTSRSSNATASFVATQIAKRWSHSGAEQENVNYAGEDKNKEHTEGFVQNKQEMLRLVDQQVQQGTVDDFLKYQRDPYMRGYAAADGPDLTVSNRPDDKEFPDFSEVRGGDDPIQRRVAKLWRAIQRRLSNPYKTDIDYVYSLYEGLPEPRIPYLHSKIRHKLLKVLGREDKNRTSMLRYFAVVEDIQRAGLRLTQPEWNSCVAFAGRWVGYVTENETSAALRMWKDMETAAGIQGNAVTFNILFDVASKAGNYVLAEMLYKEMEKRNLPWNRYHHVSLIHFFGLKMDSDGIRAAYKEMVDAGELIDTVVLNCVIAGFLRCGEEYAAERVYERMKIAHERAPMMPYRNYMNDQVVSKVLMMFAKVSKAMGKKCRSKCEPNGDVKGASEADFKGDTVGENLRASADDLDADVESDGDGGALHKHFQKQSPLTPDVHTYRILLNHYAVRMSALDKVALFLDDMKWFQIPLHGAIFLAIFKGFALHGGPGQHWSRERLQSVYTAFQSALAENANGMYVDAWMARWILRAFHRCDTEERVLEVWNELKPRCEKDFDQRDIEHFEDFLVDLLNPDKAHRGFRDRGMFGEASPKRGGGGWRG